MKINLAEEENKGVPQTFEIKRLDPETLAASFTLREKFPMRSYQTTNDEQRFWFIYKVVNKELSIREVYLTRRAGRLQGCVE